jgi:Uma2 family endonuclease
MSEVAAKPLYFASRSAFRAWTLIQPRGRFERVDGEVVAMAPERIAHARTKARVYQALDQAIRAAQLPCEALPDGVTVEVDETTDYEPDALVNCGPKAPGERVAAPNPVIVIEVLSPGNKRTDTGAKLTGYFRVSSIQHYIIFHAEKPEIVHHKRNPDNTILTRIVTYGEITLEPPGITFNVSQVYSD